MVFSSHLFLFYFLPLALLLIYALRRAPQRVANLALIVLGYGFYGWAEPRFTLLMLATTLVDWLLSLVIAYDTWQLWRCRHRPVAALPQQAPRSRLQRNAITASVVSNLSVLAFFKYFNLAADSYAGLARLLGMGDLAGSHFLRVALPLGISFYTFQSLSYTIDVYRGEARAMRNFIDFACFVSMFPHLVAGPILKFSFLAEQLERRTLTLDKFARGVAFFSLGLAKKVLIANACAGVADAAFNAQSLHAGQAWFGAVAYAFQIYFDFSGYSDMAIGLGLMLGFVFARNFDRPYCADSITDFWRRWHISLSTWLREYLYIPLGGNRRGAGRTYFNLLATMLLGGLWHGASWTFVVWGALHGGALAAERYAGQHGLTWHWPRPLRVAATFALVLVAWVFFRSPSLPQALHYLACMMGLGSAGSGSELAGALLFTPSSLLCMSVGAGVVWLARDTWDWTQRLTWPKAGACLGLLGLSMLLLATQSYNPFIYFIF